MQPNKIILKSEPESSQPNIFSQLLKLDDLFIFFYFIFKFWSHCTVYGILVPQPGIEPGPSAVKVPSANTRPLQKSPDDLFLPRASERPTSQALTAGC